MEILFCLLLFTFGRRKQNNAGVRHRFRRVSDSWAQKQDGGRPRGANTCRTFLFVVGIVFFFRFGTGKSKFKNVRGEAYQLYYFWVLIKRLAFVVFFSWGNWREKS